MTKRFLAPFAHAITLFFFAKIVTYMPISLKLFSADMPLAWVLNAVSPYFSLYNSIKPLAGAFGGVTGSLWMIGATLCSSLVFKGLAAFSLSFFAFHLPGFCASLYWATSHWAVRAGIPFGCIALFVVHPVGSQAWLYSMLWVAPLVIWVFSLQSLFLTALASTLTAHAVGSLIWLYTIPSHASFWVNLIPVAAAERILFAASMVVMYYGYALLVKQVQKVAQRLVLVARRILAA